MAETFTVSIDNNKNNTRLVEEGKSRLTPFQAEYLINLACYLRVGNSLGHDTKRVSYKARVDFLKELIEVERQHPDWHFDDFELYVRREVKG